MKSYLKYWFLCVFILFNDSNCEKFRCDYQYSNYAQGWFKYHENPLIWQDARLMCALEGAILASPTTFGIKVTLANNSHNHEIFTGLHSIFSKGNYYTVDGIPLDDTDFKWQDSEPDNMNNKQNCLVINSSGRLSDEDCDIPRPFMCYKKTIGKLTVCGTPDREYKYFGKTEKCYKFHSVPRTFARAHFACSAEGGHLAIVNSETEAQVLRELYQMYPSAKLVGELRNDIAFIGFHDWGEHGEWRTIHGQTLTEAGYDKFSKGEPNNVPPGEYCGSIFRTALLNDLQCDNQHPFICEKAPDYPPVCKNNGNVLTRQEFIDNEDQTQEPEYNDYFLN